MTTNEFFEFVIFSELKPVRNAIKNLKKELKKTGEDTIVQSIIDGFNGSFTANIKIEALYKNLAYKYLPKRINQKNFRNCFNELVLMGKLNEQHFNQIKVDIKGSSISGYPEITVSVSPLTTRNNWIDAWERVEVGLQVLKNQKLPVSLKNRQGDFLIRLKIYKSYLRAKKQWTTKFTYNDFLNTDEVMELVSKLTSKDISSKNLPNILKKFEQEFSN